jgi:hypothetical protein
MVVASNDTNVAVERAYLLHRISRLMSLLELAAPDEELYAIGEFYQQHEEGIERGFRERCEDLRSTVGQLDDELVADAAELVRLRGLVKGLEDAEESKRRQRNEVKKTLGEQEPALASLLQIKSGQFVIDESRREERRRQEQCYQEAMHLMSISRFDEASQMFCKLGPYGDSHQKKIECDNRTQEEQRKREAEQQRRAQEDELRREKKKKRKEEEEKKRAQGEQKRLEFNRQLQQEIDNLNNSLWRPGVFIRVLTGISIAWLGIFILNVIMDPSIGIFILTSITDPVGFAERFGGSSGEAWLAVLLFIVGPIIPVVYCVAKTIEKKAKVRKIARLKNMKK